MSRDNSKLINLFCHIGTPLPKYLVQNLKSTANRFPNQHFLLLTDQDTGVLANIYKNLTFSQVKSLPFKNESFLGKGTDLRFRDGFWRYTLERLIVILDFHATMPNTKLLHIESDVLLMPNFPFEFFKETRQAHWPKHGNNHDAASILFSPNAKISREIKAILLTLFHNIDHPTDMKLLKMIASQLGDSFTYLPTIPQDVLPIGTSANGVFDALGWGMFLTGIDPRNNFGITKIRDLQTYQVGESNINGNLYSYYFTNNTLFATSERTSSFPIYNLHIHTKNLKLLGFHWEEELKSILRKHNVQRRFIYFSPGLLFSLLKQNFQQKTLLPYLYSFRRVFK